jgi:ATP-binding cassette subfamily F protein 3
VHVHAGKLTFYSGDYQYYLDKTSATSARAALTAGAKAEPTPKAVEKPAKSKDQKRLEAEQRQHRSRERKEQTEFVARLEKEIGELEQKQKALTEELEKPETYEKPGRAMDINRELIYVQERLAEIGPEWEIASVKLAETE